MGTVSSKGPSNEIDKNIRILLADDHAIIRDALSSFLSQNSDIEVIAQAEDGEEAVILAREIVPDVILMDFTMPKMDGLEATRIIHVEFPQIRIIGLSMYGDNERVDAMISAGASAYCRKGDDTALLLDAIRHKVD